MNSTLSSSRRPGKLDALVYALLPLAFIGSPFLNCIAFVLDGHRHDVFRSLFVLSIQGFSVIVFLLKIRFLAVRDGKSRRTILAAVLIPLVFGLVYLWALLTLPNKVMIAKNAVVQGCYLVSSCCAVLIICCDQGLREFLRICRVYALIWAPITLYYCIRFYLPSAEYGITDLGVLSAMPLSYGYLGVCLFLLLDLVFFGREMKPACGGACGCSMALTASRPRWRSARAHPLPVLGSLLTCLISRDSLGFFRRQLAFPAVSLACILLFSTVLYPNYGVGNRFAAFLGELGGKDQVTVSNEEIQNTQDILNRVTQPEQPEKPEQSEHPGGKPSQEESPPQHGDVVDYVKSGKADEDLAARRHHGGRIRCPPGHEDQAEQHQQRRTAVSVALRVQ